MNMTELSNAFAYLGVTTALNLDGGGSTTTWMDGKLVDRPTCTDTPFVQCQRKVANILSIMSGNSATL